ncbi:hypothetical protein [uncultured Polaribacter sp.]|uniref:hypothetical protein n=1 Tax=uncultured Polaribacter sp. TaxID=174711 RepID=UPI00260C513E|nr:hypothetical protein [uncultured Polaribacter sp.]
MKKTITTFFKLSVIFTLFIATSCSNEGEVIEDQSLEVENTDFESPELLARTTCNETSFPNLGPGAASGQASGCNDSSNPNNIGTLDCRSSASFGGYANVGGGFGRYRLTGSTDRFDGTRTRVERFFNRVNRGRNKSTTLSYEFRVDEVSSGRTCIVQVHAEGEIKEGLREGRTARSAVFLLYIKKANRRDRQGREVYTAEISESTVPFVTGSNGSGTRTTTFLRNITQGIRYNLTCKTGYDNSSSQLAESTVTISGGGNTRSRTMEHTYTAEAATTRYGAYEACDTCSDDRFQIRIRNVDFCRTN